MTTAAPTDDTTPAPQTTEQDEAAAIWAQLAEAEQQQAGTADDPPAGDDGAAPQDGGAADPEPAPASAAPSGMAAAGAAPPSRQRESGQADSDDVWSSVPEPARAAYQAAQQQLARLQGEVRSDRGRLSASQRKITQLETELAAFKKAAPRTDGQDHGAQPTDAHLQALVSEYPEVGRPVVALIQQLESKIAALSAPVQRLSQRETEAARAAEEQALNEQEQALSKQIPDWAETVFARTQDGREVPRPEFLMWVRSQPPHVQRMAENNGDRIVDANEAADLIGRYKASLAAAAPPPAQPGPRQPAPLSPRRQQQLAAATGPAPRSAPRTTSGPPDDPDGAWEYWRQVEQREQQGASR